jgi:hypothetical protein
MLKLFVMAIQDLYRLIIIYFTYSQLIHNWILMKPLKSLDRLGLADKDKLVLYVKQTL